MNFQRVDLFSSHDIRRHFSKSNTCQWFLFHVRKEGNCQLHLPFASKPDFYFLDFSLFLKQKRGHEPITAGWQVNTTYKPGKQICAGIWKCLKKCLLDLSDSIYHCFRLGHSSTYKCFIARARLGLDPVTAGWMNSSQPPHHQWSRTSTLAFRRSQLWSI